MTIRETTPADAERLLEYLSAFWANGCDTVTYKSSLPTIQQEREWLASKTGDRGVVFVAEHEGRLIGMIDASVPNIDEFKHTCEFGMSVLPEARNQGVGRKLIQSILAWARHKKLRQVELNVFSNNSPAIKLYTDMGFVEDGRRVQAVKLRNGTFCDLIHMSHSVAE